jgi:hypothetical protein
MQSTSYDVSNVARPGLDRLTSLLMATRAERARYEMERAKPKKAKQPRKPRRDIGVDTSLPGTSASDRRAGNGSSAMRNLKKKGSRKATVKMEDSVGQPSRKSTRKAANHAKPGSNLTRRQIRRTTSAKARAMKAKSSAR